VPFTIEVRDGSDKVLATAELSPGLSAALPRYDDEAYPVLRFLDEYGDTYLNSLQVRQLVEELDQLRGEVPDHDGASLDELVRAARLALDAPHRQLIFIGD
jgi:hypothetical protein